MTEPVTPGTAIVAMPTDSARLNAIRDQLSTDLDTLEFAMHTLDVLAAMLGGEGEDPADALDTATAARIRRDNMSAIRHACRLVENRGNRAIASGKHLLALIDPNSTT